MILVIMKSVEYKQIRFFTKHYSLFINTLRINTLLITH
jgi:hypothetical protein